MWRPGNQKAHFATANLITVTTPPKKEKMLSVSRERFVSLHAALNYQRDHYHVPATASKHSTDQPEKAIAMTSYITSVQHFQNACTLH